MLKMLKKIFESFEKCYLIISAESGHIEERYFFYFSCNLR